MSDVFVPPEQVIDTADLYFLPSRQRRLSLRFLAWIVLGENIQTDTVYDCGECVTGLLRHTELITARRNDAVSMMHRLRIAALPLAMLSAISLMEVLCHLRISSAV